MNDQLHSIIVSHYGLRNVRIASAPRQFVAETYIVKTADRQTFFCKVVDKPLFIPKIISSLPVLDALHNVGFERINFPIKTLTDSLYVRLGETLVVLFNYIEAEQSYDFDYEAFGRLLGEVHAVTDRIKVVIPTERFLLKHSYTFEAGFEEILTTKSRDVTTQGLQYLLLEYESEIRRHYASLQRIIDECSYNNFHLVITHGDAGGNVLVKAPTDLYLIDWDEILLAPPERDLWTHSSNPAIMAGYRSVFPQYQMNEVARKYCTCSQYFDYIAYFLAEILGDSPEPNRQNKLRDLGDYFEGWIRPYIDDIY